MTWNFQRSISYAKIEIKLSCDFFMVSCSWSIKRCFVSCPMR
uniref:Uncharacterized protein n=1 Tax=Rhizophora mucronata TaxID=61149 RepID=A0A2P2P4T3_RHIMU